MRVVAARAARLSPISRYVVADDSMLPAFRAGERVAVNRLAYVLHAPRTGDAIVLRDPGMPSRYLLKRIAARTRVDDGETSYDVRGDNTGYSRDSRAFGAVHQARIVGKVWFKY